MIKNDELRKVILECIDEHQKNMELERLRQKMNEKETVWTLMKRGFYENVIWLALDTSIWIGLLLWLGVF